MCILRNPSPIPKYVYIIRLYLILQAIPRVNISGIYKSKAWKHLPGQLISSLFISCERYPDRQLDSGTLAAPGKVCLVLLHSCPDTVRSFPSRKTQMSSLPAGGSFTHISIYVLICFVNQLLTFLFLAKLAEKAAHQCTAFFLKNSFCQFHLMIELTHL